LTRVDGADSWVVLFAPFLMKLLVFSILCGIVACRSEPRWDASAAMRGVEARQEPGKGVDRGATEQDPVLLEARALFEQGRGAREAKDFETARARFAAAIEVLDDIESGRESKEWADLLSDLGKASHESGDLHAARAAWNRVVQFRERTLPGDHPDLQLARLELATSVRKLGDLQAARELQEEALEVFCRTLPEDHPDLQKARRGLAATLSELGDLHAARELLGKVLEVYTNTLPDDHPDLQRARGDFALTLRNLGDLNAARELQEKVLETFVRTLPDDHPDMQMARLNLGSSLFDLGDLAAARELEEKGVEVYSRTLPGDHPDLQKARMNLAGTLFALGDVAKARELLEKVLEVRSRTLPEDHPDLQRARLNLAIILRVLGDLHAARELQQKVLEVRSRTLPDDHLDLQKARMNLANTLADLGDLHAARELQEKVLAVLSRTLPDDHPFLQAARGNLALTSMTLGDLHAARGLQEKVLEVLSRTLPGDHPDLQKARLNLANTVAGLGDQPAARKLQEEVLEIYSRTLPEDHPDLHWARLNLAATLSNLGELHAARELQERVVEFFSLNLHETHRDLQSAREILAWICVALRDGPSAASLVSRLSQSCRQSISPFSASPRELEARATDRAWLASSVISIAQGAGLSEPVEDLAREAFLLVESVRGAGLLCSRVARTAAADPELGALREEIRAASDELARIVEGDSDREALADARRRRDDAQRELAARLSSTPEGRKLLLEPGLDTLPAILDERDALVAYWRYERITLDPAAPSRETRQESLVAFVVRAENVLSLVELGPIDAIEAAVQRWREAIGPAADARGVGGVGKGAAAEREAGEVLRRLVLDPLLPSLEGVDHLVVALDDVLHLVPPDALPRDDGCVGDRLRIEVRPALWELLLEDERPTGGTLVALGGVDYGAVSGARGEGQNGAARVEAAEAGVAQGVDGQSRASAPAKVSTVESSVGACAWVARSGPGTASFVPLPATAEEAETIASLWEEQDLGPSMLLTGTHGSRADLLEAAPRARFVHIATHGWYAPESIQSTADPQPLDRWTGLGVAMSRLEQVRGSSPMVLCGLALAGANLPEDELGRVSGLITAEEIAALDLSNCELAVLSACDTGIGELRRAGQGVASLQKALHMAGARSVITSLWKVPDEATRELMVDFYRRLWVEKKPKHRALWEAKLRLRESKDDRGKPKYGVRDWAAWVLTGDPN